MSRLSNRRGRLLHPIAAALIGGLLLANSTPVLAQSSSAPKAKAASPPSRLNYGDHRVTLEGYLPGHATVTVCPDRAALDRVMVAGGTARMKQADAVVEQRAKQERCADFTGQYTIIRTYAALEGTEIAWFFLALRDARGRAVEAIYGFYP